MSLTEPVTKESTEGEELKKLRFVKFETGMRGRELFGGTKALTTKWNNQMSMYQPSSSVDLPKLRSVELFYWKKSTVQYYLSSMLISYLLKTCMQSNWCTDNLPVNNQKRKGKSQKCTDFVCKDNKFVHSECSNKNWMRVKQII